MRRTAALLEELRRYEPADELERLNHRELIDLLTRSDAPFARFTFDPGHVTASVFIIDGAGRLLLHHHRRLGRWLQMGGHLEEGETPADAALREGREESGLADLRLVELLDIDVHPIPAGKGEPDHRHFDIRYLARTALPESIVIDSSESIDLMWFDLREAAEVMGSPESRRVIRKISEVLCVS